MFFIVRIRYITKLLLLCNAALISVALRRSNNNSGIDNVVRIDFDVINLLISDECQAVTYDKDTKKCSTKGSSGTKKANANYDSLELSCLGE